RTMLWTLAVAATATAATAQEATETRRGLRRGTTVYRSAEGQEAVKDVPGIPNFPSNFQFTPEFSRRVFGVAMDEADDPTLGATLVPVPDRLRTQLKIDEGHGLVARVVEPDGPAARSGIKANDILLALNGQPLAKPEDFVAILKKSSGDAPLDLMILRGGKSNTLKVRRVETVTCGPAEEPERSDYVLGVAVSVPDDALRAHLDIPEDRGLLVDQVIPGSAAEKGGVKQNDVLLSVAGKPLDGTDALVKQIRESKDKATELRLLREGKEITLVVTPEKRSIKARAESSRSPLRMWMFDPSNQGEMRFPGGPRGGEGFNTLREFRVPGPMGPAGGDDRIDKLEGELKALRESIEALKDAVKAGKKGD
ncbi:MAG: PDZ domain-containing protein, partial [Thermoleophilia bacterium]|nr:PDZ domain-containing protein [Thermoleophilia bacterium]